MRTRSSAARGFTLMELMIVLAIISLLAVALLPNVIGGSRRAQETETTMRIQFLRTSIEAFARRYGFYPPDDFQSPDRGFKVVAKADPLNPGIESLIIFLHQRRLGADSLADHEDWLSNTDHDKNTALIPGLDRLDKVEVIDAWGTPLAYFSSQSGGYERAQRIVDQDGVEVKARAVKNPRTGKYHAPGKYQIISAGPDGVFGENDEGKCDDLVFPPLPVSR